MHTSTSSGKFRYPGVKPFTPEEQDLFFGREKDIADLFTLIFVRQIVVLYGKSGYGKSSLINAGIIPKLQAETKFKPFTIRFTNYIDKENTPSPTDTVRGRLSAELPDQSSPLDQLLVREDSFWYLIKTRQWLQETSQVVLIFDQFEELFSYPKEQIKAFSEQLSQLLYTTIPVQFRKPLNELDERGELSDDFHEFLYQKPDVKVVFSVRSDRLSLLNMLTAQHPTILQHCYELDALSPHEARKAIIQPARLPKELGFGSPRFSYSKEVLEAILKGVANPQDGKIETATLQIICRYVEETLAKDQADSEVTREMLGDITDIFRQYYEGVLNRLPPEDRQKAQRLIEEKLITGNQRNALSEAFIKKEFDIDDKLLKTLETSSLLRKERDASGRLLYEVSHDTLVEPVQKVAELRLKKEEEEEKAELERQIQKEKDRVRERDEALKEKQKLIDAFYFHEDKFALAINSFSSISNSLKDKKFYFIDKEGNEWTHLGRWDKAEQFDEDSGFAKVSIKNEDRLSSFNSTGKPEENDSDNSKKGNDFGTSKFEYNNKKNEGGEEGDNNNSVKPEEKGSVKQKKESIKSKERSYRDYLLDVHGNSYRVCYELSDLDKEITAVDLRGKHFSEIFPSKILEYPQLQILIIDGQNDKKNRFNAIPPGLAKLKNLIYLSFQFCEINKFPDVLGGLKKLQKLLLGNNQLEFIPEALCELTELTELSLSSNQLKEIPESISNLSKLQKLYLDKNQLELLPEALYKLRELNELHLTENKLNEISGKIANLKELEILSLSGNKLAKLPNSFWELREIRQIGLWGNQLSEISESIGNLSKLQKLYLEQNPLESIPEALYELTELTELSLSSTQLKEIPESIGNLSKLQVLSLSENQLKSIPEGFYKLRELKEVYLWSNQLSEISESIGNLSKLQKLYLEQNQLESIPESLYELQELTELYLWSNQLKEISESIGKLSKLRTLSFDQNQLESIPEALCELYQLTELGLSGNKIKAIPIHIDNCLKLQIQIPTNWNFRTHYTT